MVVRATGSLNALRLPALLDTILTAEMAAEAVWASDGALTHAFGDSSRSRTANTTRTRTAWSAADQSTGHTRQRNSSRNCN
eukprot:7388601-Prymnesium_polylepis.1